MAPEGPRGFAIWITGLPASGKSSITSALMEQLRRRGTHAAVLNSDTLRKSFATQQEYGEQDREYFYGSVAFIGHVLTEHGINVIFDATANRRSYRDRARKTIPVFFEIFVDTPLEVCTARDPKGIYRAAKTGRAEHVPGIQVEYEPPVQPDLVIRGDSESPQEAALRIVQLLEERGIVL